MIIQLESLESALEGTSRNKGLGYWREQASESVHNSFTQLWEKGEYKRKMIISDENRLEEYKTNFLNCVVTYNSRRENPAGQTDLTQEMSSHSGAISDELVDQETGLQLEPEPEPSSDTVLVLDTGLDMEPLSEPEELQEEDEQDKA